MALLPWFSLSLYVVYIQHEVVLFFQSIWKRLMHCALRQCPWNSSPINIKIIFKFSLCKKKKHWINSYEAWLAPICLISFNNLTGYPLNLSFCFNSYSLLQFIFSRAAKTTLLKLKCDHLTPLFKTFNSFYFTQKKIWSSYILQLPLWYMPFFCLSNLISFFFFHYNHFYLS
jgi:hypothetical protein